MNDHMNDHIARRATSAFDVFDSPAHESNTPNRSEVPRRADPPDELSQRQEVPVVVLERPDTEEVPHGPTRWSPSRLRLGLIASDVIAIVIGISLASLALLLLFNVPVQVAVEHTLLGLAALPGWLAAMAFNRLFTARTLDRRLDEVRRVLTSNLGGAATIVGLAFTIGYFDLSRAWVGFVYVFSTITLVTSRGIARRAFAWLRRAGYCTRPVIVVGSGEDAHLLIETVNENPGLGYEVVGIVGDRADHTDGAARFLGTTDDAIELIDSTPATGVILSAQSLSPDTVNSLTRRLTRSGYHVTLSSALRDIDVTRARPQEIDGQLLIYIEPSGTSVWGRVGKSVFDFAIAVIMLALAAPILAIAALAIKLGSDGPVIFSQQRVGRDGQPFRLYKLRTMTVDAEEIRQRLIEEHSGDRRLFKLDDDPRVTRVGRFLRRTSIDELPQLWNVLRGEMSVVGPRPALPEEARLWTPDVHERLRVLPGITGMWQVYGRSDADFQRYKRLDLYYVDNWSLLRDLAIIARTFRVVVFGRGAR